MYDQVEQSKLADFLAANQIQVTIKPNQYLLNIESFLHRTESHELEEDYFNPNKEIK